MREMYLMDSLGLRRFTHNEIAWSKGIEGYDFNTCSNKRSMYRKLADAGSVFVAEVVAKSVRNYVVHVNYGWEESNRWFENDEWEENDGWEEVEYQDETLPEPPETEEKKEEKSESQKVIIPKLRLTNIHINTLKGLKNLDLPIEQNLTAIMGVNGCGKSTILHALACAFKPHEDGNNYKFSFFFTPNPDTDWKNSSLEVTYFDENEQREITRTYKKDQDRWSPRYTNRPMRDVFFMGIDTCIPEIEREKQTSFIDYSTASLGDKDALKVTRMAAKILNKDYKNLTIHKTDKKEMLGVRTADDLTYSSLSMGAGEQRVIKILRLLYSVNHYSLILIDEIDLLLHVTALKELIKVIHEVAKKKNLQVIFTTHSLEVAALIEYVDVKYLDVTEHKTMVLRCITPDIVYKMSHVVEKPIQIYVEDLLAEIIVKKIAADLNILRFARIVKFGASSNAYVIAASYILRQEKHDNILFVLDGDVDIEDEEKQKAVNKVLSGTEADHEAKVNQAVSMIRQFHLPENTAPEKHIFDMLIQMDSSNEIMGHAKRLKAVRDSHEWLDELTDRMGQSEEWTLSHIMDIVAENPGWEDFVREVRDWLVEKRAIWGLEEQDEV
ncbi:MAG: AAA family ATPase [Acetatifactor sp.]|nr:AAA family ATPase [Acetatifactor sp.]